MIDPEDQTSAEMGTGEMGSCEMGVTLAQQGGRPQAVEGGLKVRNPWVYLPEQSTTWTLI